MSVKTLTIIVQFYISKNYLHIGESYYFLLSVWKRRTFPYRCFWWCPRKSFIFLGSSLLPFGQFYASLHF